MLVIPWGVRLKRQAMTFFAELFAVIVVAVLAFGAVYDYRYWRRRGERLRVSAAGARSRHREITASRGVRGVGG